MLGATQCSNDAAQTCVTMPDGCTAWGSATPCAVGCQGNACSCDQCTPGQTSCAGGLLTSCVLGNGCYGWNAGTACPTGQTCGGGVCASGATTITQNTVLCGDQYYTGAFAIQGGATVTCPSGTLSIHAPSISIDPASAIDLSASSSAPGGVSGYTSCLVTGVQAYCGGQGGGYGTPGGSSVGYSIQQFTAKCQNEIMPAGAPAFGSLYDALVSPGTAGGDGDQDYCPPGAVEPAGGKGGGSVQLLAGTQASILGKVLVNGGNGGTGVGSCQNSTGAGAGSGGGVLLMAPSLQIGATAQISAGGGTASDIAPSNEICPGIPGGNGGLGRIKILYGDTYLNQGTLTGSATSNSITWMPPATITSATQPSPTLFYNDGLTQPLAFAWQEPFTGVVGYYYAFGTDPALQLTMSNGTATVGTGASIPAAQVTGGGAYYFYVLSVNASVMLSSVANRFTVQINSTPDTLTSPSHPDPSMWYQGALSTTLSVAWAPPAGVPASNFRGYYYRVDQVSDTAPPDVTQAVTGWTATTSTSVVTTQDATGTALQNGTYYFHLVALDSAGIPTKVAAHYLVQIGPQPAQTSFFGYVKKQGTPVPGATVGLQPYGLTTTTDVNGYFILQNVYEEAAVVTVSGTGITTTQQDVTVSPAVSPYNIAL